MKAIHHPRLAAYALLFALRTSAIAAPADLDSTFGIAGKVTTDLGSGIDSGEAVVVQINGQPVAEAAFALRM